MRLVRFELTRPKAHVLNVVRPTKLRHSRIDSASWIRTSSIPGFKPRWSASCLSRRKVAATNRIRSRVPDDTRCEDGQRWPYGSAPCTSWGQIRTVSTTWFEQVRSTNCLPSHKYPRKDSNFHCSRSKRDDSCQLVYVGSKRRVSVSTRYFLFDRQVCTANTLTRQVGDDRIELPSSRCKRDAIPFHQSPVANR